MGGAVRLRQPKTGYRAGLDAALLAASLGLQAGERGFEAGCGVGAVLLQAAARSPHAQLVGMERDPASLALAEANIAMNALQDRVRAVEGEVGRRFPALGLAPFDVAFANPPFFDDPGALRAPSPERMGAWMAEDGLAAWTAFLLKAVREGGRVVVVHRADRLADLLAGLGQGGGAFRIRPVHAFAGRPAKRVLVQATKAGRGPLALLPPLVLREGDAGRPEADLVLRGEADLGWG
ncbi:methyltransferase [Caulobacter sp. S45]|uniref:methyltransferase n=1 Tax=Caulobacter sp. S45 TaxID=1641861 RepID=UPI0020C6DC6E|nr:methyltransferase [Caulobacter sp. S45]